MHIDHENLPTLVNKTLEFLQDFADPASALTMDIKILESVAQKVGLWKRPIIQAQ
jgi:hypothetical protein